ncbi:MAG: potassium-transporting ATPase subunit KdpA [Candidatus Magnetoovum sp. WYHC-5]|nr:potassium-transporting ATPase subunit KdpA [Candidatus Magnetoovum sp. WYHC-5]
MTVNGLLQIAIFLTVVGLLAKPLGNYIALVYDAKISGLSRLERLIYRICGVHAEEEMSWRTYASAVIVFSVAGFAVVFLLQLFQGFLPLNPQGFKGVSFDSSFNTAVSFVTNTNWQGYGGEATMSYLTQMMGLCVQNFLSAATGMAIMVALIRGFTRRNSKTIGNFWLDITHTILYILLPLSILLAIALVSQGVIQNFNAYRSVPLMQPLTYNDSSITQQVLPGGPAASQVAIKQLGTNGGGFFNTNSAHPYENPTPLSNFLELLAIILIPASLCYTFGSMVGDKRQGRTLLAAMLIIFIPLLMFCYYSEMQDIGSAGNMEGKEARFGVVNSALWATATAATSNGSVDSMHDSFTPLGGLVPLLLIQLGEVVFGGVGSGIYGILAFAIVTVFVSGLMIGRTPEYLGKKIEAFEMQMATLVILIPCSVVLVGTAIAVATDSGTAGVANPGAHGFSEILYAFSSTANNNGSAFGGLSVNTPFYNTILGVSMLIGRFGVIIPILMMAGALADKKHVPVSSGTLPTHGLLFILFLTSMIIIVGGLTFFPALTLGPIAEHLKSIK